jgi:CelD/BcsL family acetyltransferase involved in cellulose biosynthesis
MKITSLRPSQLSADHLDAWRRLQQAEATYDSPFFTPEFTQAVAEVRNDVFVAVIEDEQPVGFLPYQMNSLGFGHPVGWRLNDFQGPIIQSGVHVDTTKLLRSCRLINWRFDHLATGISVVDGQIHGTAPSPFIDLSKGFNAYRESCRASGSKVIKQTERKMRKVIREVGELRLEFQDTGRDAFEALLRMKAKQLRQAGEFPVINHVWVRCLLERVRKTDVGGFAGQLTSLYAGEHLIAVHFGIRSRNVIHWWMPTYDPRFEQYSPGALLLLRSIEEAAASGIQRIDLGKGNERYKQRFQSGFQMVGEGALCRGPLLRQCSRLSHGARRIVRKTRLRTASRTAKRIVRTAKSWLAKRLSSGERQLVSPPAE